MNEFACRRLTCGTKTLVVCIYRARFMARTLYKERARHDFVRRHVSCNAHLPKGDKVTTKYRVSLLLMIILLYVSNSYSQEADTSSQRALSDSAANSFKWHVKTSQGGSLMSLSVPYTFEGIQGDALLRVSKTDRERRPTFISLTLPSTIDHYQGVFLAFAKTSMKDGKWSMELVPNKTVHVGVGASTDSTFIITISRGIVPASDQTGPTDLFDGFLNYDNLLIMFFINGTHKTLMVPLPIFREQYEKLP